MVCYISILHQIMIKNIKLVHYIPIGNIFNFFSIFLTFAGILAGDNESFNSKLHVKLYEPLYQKGFNPAQSIEQLSAEMSV